MFFWLKSLCLGIIPFDLGGHAFDLVEDQITEAMT